MIKYKVLVKGIDESFTEVGTIEGNNKRDLALKLNKLCHIYNIDINTVKLECIQFDKIENL